MADQANERPQQAGQAAGLQAASAGSPPPAIESDGASSSSSEVLRRQPMALHPAAEAGSGSPRLNQEAVPLSPVDTDPLTEAARHFRELQTKSAGVTEMHMPARPAQTGDVARDLLKDDGQLSSLALSPAANWPKPDHALPADMLTDGDSAAARVTPRVKLRSVTNRESVIDVEARPLDRQPTSPTFVDMDPDLSLPATTPPAPASSPSAAESQISALSSSVADLPASSDRNEPIAANQKPDEVERALALVAQAPIVRVSPEASEAELSAMKPVTADAAVPRLPPFPAIDRERRLPAGPSGNLRLFAGLSIVIAAFAGSLVWVAMWRADSFSGGAQATIEVSPEDLVETAAGTNTTVASAESGGTATVTLMVRDTELLLAKLAFDPGPADGVLDDTTREAIRRYQQAAGLPETGEPSKELLEELQDVVAAIGGN